MSLTTTTDVMTTHPDLCIFVRRYDKPRVMVGVHYRVWNGDRYIERQAPQLMPNEKAIEHWGVLLKNGGYRILVTSEDGSVMWPEMDEDLRRVVRNCCPIEFHRQLAENDPVVTDRITILVRESQA